MASPIQIILNHENFEEAREAGGGGGPRKDFFAERDAEFRAHKKELTDQLASIAAALEKQQQGNIGHIKVLLRREAWAKSHRPIRALFKPDRIRMVGGGDLGQMYFEAQPNTLRIIAQGIQTAEEQTNLQFDKHRRRKIPNPSPVRSETGAIDRIEIYGPQDRRHFSVEDAVAWLSQPMTGSSYQVELFDVPSPHSQWDSLEPNRRLLYASFLEGIASTGEGLSAQRLITRGRSQPIISVRLGRSSEPPILHFGLPTVDRKRSRDVVPFDPNLEHHRRLLNFLDHHPLVRRIELPAIVTRTIANRPSTEQRTKNPPRTYPASLNLPVRNSARTYPKLGIIDGGMSKILSDWVIDRWDLLNAGDINEDHGTFIGGLVVAGNSINGNEVCDEPDGAEIVDVAVYPNDPGTFASYYPDGVPQFFDEVEFAVSDATARHKVRVFNLSLNVQHPAAPDRYSIHAARLDSIAEATGAVFFISAGNTTPQDIRPEWPADDTQALVALASARNDSLLIPAESVRNVSVAALNPPGLSNVLPFAPARYSRRGPGLRAGVKPDLAHVGGSGSPHHPLGHGLFSIRPGGDAVDGCGTSYAAPFVAKTAAVLDHSIEGEVSRETLVALLLHHARVPEILQSAGLSAVARDLAGLGMPMSAREILEGDDHQITLVFASRIRPDQQISFKFSWPPSLVSGGKCRGAARLTLVSSPPLDLRFGAEFVRVNIDAALQQENLDNEGKLHWKGRLDPIYLPGKGEVPVIEAEQIEHGLKWSPTKVYGRTMPNGVGKSSNWRMLISYLTRTAEEIPPDGVPFTAILTISDPDREAPVFTEMRQVLNALGVRIEDIRVATRVATRV